MDGFDEVVLRDFKPAYIEPDGEIESEVSFDIDYYKSHYLPVREVIELRKATHE